ncbi:hypothetical protein PIB30_077031 [Stylosanthes scabra]|uniref:Uncharacterized protein n=1 Tax=Stylosanthes scabra TaxID=79078 RepID=A0ABU6YS96_9FABA|nr:hypothetical protein [Stylosanthes scabra]
MILSLLKTKEFQTGRESGLGASVTYLLVELSILLLYIWMVREGKAPAKAPTSVATGSTTRNPSQPLNSAYSDTECQNNARKLVVKNPIFELRSCFQKRSKRNSSCSTDTISED